MATKPLPGVAPVSSENLQFVIPVDSVGEPPLVAPVLQENMQFVMPEVREPSMFEMTRDFNEFKSYYQAGAFDSDIEGVGDVTDIALEAGGAILSDVGSWLGSLPQRVAANFSDDPKVRAKAKATTLQVLGSLGENYEALGAGVKRGVYKMTEDEGSDLDLHSAWKYWQKTADLESQRQGLAAEVLANGIFGISGDAWTAGMSDEEKKLIREGIVKPDVEAAMGGAMIVDPLNYFPIGLAYRGATGGSKAALTGAERVLLKETQDMLNLQAKMLPTSKFFLAANTAEMTAVGARQKAALAELNTKIAANSAKLPPLAQKRTIALNAMKDSLPEGSAMRGLLDDALTDVPISAGRNITGIAAASAPVVAGKFIETLGNVGAFLKMLPYETAVNTVMKIAEKAAGKEISEETAKKLLLGGAVFGAGYASTGRAESGAIEFLLPDIGKVELAAAATALLGPTFLKRFGRDLSIAGRQLANPKETLPYLGALAAKGSEKLVDQIIDRDVLVPVASVARRVTGAAEGKIPQRMFLPQGKLGPVSSGIATFMDRSGLGRYAETAGRAARGGAQGAAVAGAFGLAASGGMENPEAFYGSLGVGAILGTAGSTFGSVARFDSPAQHWTARYGDYEYYIKNYLGEGQKENFNKLNRDLQIAVAHKIVTNPSLEVTFASKGKTAGGGHLNRLTNALEINVDSPRAMEALISHEFTHYLEQTGGKLAFNELLIGNSILGKPGIFVERVTPETKSKYPDLNVGDPIMVGEEGARRYKFTKEFETARKEYKDKLKDTDEFSNLTEAQLDLIMTDELVVSEIVAEHGTDFFANDRRRYRDLHRGAIGKVMEGLLDTQLASNVPFLRKALAMLGGTFRPDGRLITDNALFSKLKRYPQITELVRKYNRRIEGLSPEQMKKKTASVDGDGNVISTKDVVVDVTGAELSKNPELVDLIRAGTFLQIDKDGNVIPNLAMTSREKGKYNRSFAQSLKDAIERQDADIGLPEGHVKPEVNEKTGKVKFVGRYLDDSVLDAVEKSGNWNKEQIAMLREANNNIKNRGGNEFLISYFKAAHQGGRRYINAKVENLVEVPYGIEITQQGNVLIRTVSVDQLIKNVDQLTRQQQRELTRLYGADLNTAKTMLLNDVDAYHRNHAAGEPGRTGLDADQAIAKAKADFINSAFGSGTKAQVDANPWRAGLGKKQPRDVYRSRRIERIGKLTQLSGERYVDYNLINKAFMPRRKPGPDDTIPLPFPELPGDIPGEGFGRLINVDKSKSEIAKAKAMADEQDGFSSSGTVRAKNADGRDKLFMPASEARKRLKDLELSAKKDPLDDRSRNHMVQKSLLQGIIDEAQGGRELDLKIGSHKAGQGSHYIEYLSEGGDSFKIRATDHDRQLSSITNHPGPDFTLASIKKNVSEISGDWIDAIVKLENETDFRVPKRLEDRINSIISRREETQRLRQTISQQERIQRERAGREAGLARENALETPKGKSLSDEIDKIRLELQQSSGTGKYSRNQRQSMFKKVKRLEEQLESTTFDAGDPNMLFMPAAEAGAPKGKQAEAAKLWQEKGTDSPFFKKWFGKSKVVDESGEPLRVFHGTDKEFSAFDPSKLGDNTDAASAKEAFFASSSESVAESYMRGDSGGLGIFEASERGSVLRGGEKLSLELGRVLEGENNIRRDIEAAKAGGEYLELADYLPDSFLKISDEHMSLFGDSGQKIADAREGNFLPLESVGQLWEIQTDISHQLRKWNGLLENASVKELFLKIENPYDVKWSDKRGMTISDIIAHAKANGHDGGIIRSIEDAWNIDGSFNLPPADHHFWFKPEQAKSATGNRGTFDAGDPNMLFMPADEAGAPKGKQAEAAKLWQEKGTDSPFFKKWFGKLENLFGRSKVVDESGEPLLVAHGTTKKFNEFDISKTSNATFDVGYHFGGKETAQSRLKDLDHPTHPLHDWYGEPQIKEVYLDIKTPLRLGENRSGSWQPSDYLAAIFDPENTFWKTNKIDPKKVPEAFRSDIKKYMDADEVADMHGGLIQASVKGLGKLAFQDLAEHSYMGKQAGHEWVKNYLKSKGFDGIIYTNKFEGGGDSYIAFSPEQIKSATGNRGTFDAGDPNMLFMPAATPESVSPNTVQSWDGDPSFPGKYTRGQAKSNDDVGKLFQEKYVEKYGEPINPYDYTPETTGWLGGMLYGEAKVALARAGNAVDWYTKAVAKAMTIAEDIFPEIKTSAAAKDNFLGALAITSQNMRVLDNARAAVHQYDYKQKHGVFDYKKKHGGKGKMITENLRMFDTLEAKLGSDFNAFLDKDFTVKELTEFGQKFFGKEKFTIEGRINDEVKGSAVFGPKIGQGFFQNLKGNYLPVTIDLWLRRTFGRLTGRSVSIKLKRDDIGRLIYSHRKNKGKRKAKDFELPDFLKKVQITGGFTKDGKMNFKIPESTFDRLFGEHEQGMANAEAVFDLTKRLAKEWGREYSTTDRAVAKLKAELSKQKKAGQPVKQTAARLEKAEAAKATLLEEKPFWAFASASISGKLKPIDIPTPQERTVIVDAFHFALKKLKAEGYDLTPADLQATLWYPEKDIWAFLKGENADSLNMSYDKAMEMIRDERR